MTIIGICNMKSARSSFAVILVLLVLIFLALRVLCYWCVKYGEDPTVKGFGSTIQPLCRYCVVFCTYHEGSTQEYCATTTVSKHNRM